MKKSELTEKLDLYLMEEKLDEKSENTQKQYRRVIKSFIDQLENEDVSKLDLMKFKQSLLDKYAPKTINNYITIVNKFIKYIEITEGSEDEFDFTKLKRYYSKNNLKNIKIQEKASLEDVLEAEELKRMLRTAKKNDYELFLIIEILVYTGIRISELRYFTYENIQSNFIEVKNKGKVRNVILRNNLRKKLLDYCTKKGIENGPIFQGKKDGTMLHNSTIRKRLKRIAGQARGIKIDKVHPHAFRHLFAIKFLEDGGDITELADILGHSSIDTTKIYTRSTDKMKKRKIENMKY